MLVTCVIPCVLLYFSLPYSHSMVVHCHSFGLIFLSHLWRFNVEGFLQILNVTLVAYLVLLTQLHFFQFTQLHFRFSSLSCMLSLTHLVPFQVQLTQLHLSLARLVAFQVYCTQFHSQSSSLNCILILVHLVTFLVQLTQLYFRFISLSYIFNLAHLVIFLA